MEKESIKISKDIAICGTFMDDDGFINIWIDINGSSRTITKSEAEKLIEALQKLVKEL